MILSNFPKDRNVAQVSSIHSIENNGVITLYVVNFESDEGYMIITADKTADWAILAFNETGSLDPSKIDEESPFAVWFNGMSELSYSRITSPLRSSDNDIEEFWIAFEEPLKEGEELLITLSTIDKKTAGKETELRGTHKDSWGLSSVPPYSIVKNALWGQAKGYNADAKFPGALAGCPAVAIGMYCKAKWTPLKYDYSNMPNELTTTSSNAISRMFRDIADNIPYYRWGTNASGARPNDVLTGLHNLGFAKAKIKAYDFSTTYNQIKNNYPVLLAGFSNSGGHIWIADGYWEQKWTVTKKFLWWKVKSWTEYSDMLYMNWDWYGQGNAWIDQAEWPNYGYERTMYYDIKE